MSFIWPSMLLALGAVPLLIGLYVWLRRHRDRNTADLGSLGFVPTAEARKLGWRRHVPFAIFMAAISLLLAGFSRPEMVVDLPRVEGTVILAFDNSNSMLADDLDPTRIDAAKAAALAFVDEQPSTVRVGVVSFSNGGVVLQPPTSERRDVARTIERLKPEGGTSLGQGLFTSLSAITGGPIPITEEAIAAGEITALDIGTHTSAVIVLLTDGENTDSFDPLQVAQLAANSGIRIFPIGLGSTDGTVMELDGFSIVTALDDEVLEEIANISAGDYFDAASEADFEAIYDSIDLELTIRGDKIEITGLLAAIGAVLLLIGAAISMLWFGRVP